MKKRASKRGLSAIILILSILIISNFVGAVEIVQKPTEQPKQASNPLIPPFIIGGIVVLVLAIIFIAVLVAIINAVAKYIQNKNDTFVQIKESRITLAMAQGRYHNRVSWWKFWNYGQKVNPSIRLARIDKEGKVRVTKPVATYFGDFQSHEGNIYIVCTIKGMGHLWGFIPIKQLICIPNREKIEVLIRNKDNKNTIEVETIANIPKAKEIVQFDEESIIIYADGISNAGEFHYPVLKAKDGKIIDLSIPVYESIKEVAMNEMMYMQTHLFGKAMKQGIGINPVLNYQVKTGDSNQNVDATSN